MVAMHDYVLLLLYVGMLQIFPFDSYCSKNKAWKLYIKNSNSLPIFATDCSKILWDESIFCLNKILKVLRELRWIWKFLANLGIELSVMRFVGKSRTKFCFIVCVIWEDLHTVLLEADLLEATMRREYLIKKSLADLWSILIVIHEFANKGSYSCAVWR